MVVSDRPGGIAELTRTISNVGVSIKDIVHERAWVRTNAFAVGVSTSLLYFGVFYKILFVGTYSC